MDGGHTYHRSEIDRDGKSQSVFFLVDRVMAAEGAALKPNKK